MHDRQKSEVPSEIETAVLVSLGEFIDIFNAKDFDLVDRKYRTSKISLTDVWADVKDFGKYLTPSPTSALEIIPTIDPDRWAFVYDLWVDGEETDLSVEGWVLRSESGLSVEIDNIHMM